jgi:hypothetical protein
MYIEFTNCERTSPPPIISIPYLLTGEKMRASLAPWIVPELIPAYADDDFLEDEVSEYEADIRDVYLESISLTNGGYQMRRHKGAE